MPTIRRSALVEHSAARMFALVNDIEAYPRRFDWCDSAQVLEADASHVIARLDLGYDPFTGGALGRTVKVTVNKKF